MHLGSPHGIGHVKAAGMWYGGRDMNAPEFAAKVGANKSSNGWMAKCPAHKDQNPSLSIAEGQDGRVLLKCHAGCRVEDILAKLDIPICELFPPADAKPVLQRREVATYDYTDETGKLLFQAVRYEPKDFRQRRPDGNGGWFYNLQGVRRVLFHLPDVIAAIRDGGTVFVVEGERDAISVAEYDLVATCNPMGAGKWCNDYTAMLTGAEQVVIIADKDEPGRKHATAVATALHGVVKLLKVVELPDWKGKSVKDFTDFIDAGAKLLDFLVVIGATPAWTPPSLTVTKVDPNGEVDGAWSRLILFDEPASNPQFPVEVYPAVFSDFAREVAAMRQVPIDLPATLVLGSLSIACAGRVRVKVGNTFEEPTNLYILPLLPPGERKSGTFSDCLAPITIFEVKLGKESQAKRAQLAEQRECDAARLLELRRKAARLDEPEARHALEAEAKELAANLADVPPIPRLLCGDVTPEKLVTLIAENSGRMAQVDAEGGVFFNMIGGQYSKSGAGNFEVYLKAHAGDPIRVDRTSRAGEFIEHPALTLVLTGQPDLLRNMANRETLRGRGLLARFLYSLPESQVGFRLAQDRTMDNKTRDDYATMVASLLADDTTRLLWIEGDAWKVWQQQADALELDLRPDGSLFALRDWAGKLAGAVARTAALLHMAGNPKNDTIPADTVAGAWRIGNYFRAHALAAFSLMDGDPRLALARRLLAWIRRHRCEHFTLAEVFADLRRGEGVAVSDDLLPAVAVLEDRHYVRSQPPQEHKVGRKPSPAYTVNPATHEAGQQPKGH
jgi:5S rRNA maturation endonuclease (ribonuclease M5)